MSRLSGFVVSYRDEEIFSITWKNYLNVDGIIYGVARGCDLTYNSNTHQIDETELIFHSSKDFIKVADFLTKNLDGNFFNDYVELMNKEVDDATYEWNRILVKLNAFIDNNIRGISEEQESNYQFVYFCCD